MDLNTDPLLALTLPEPPPIVEEVEIIAEETQIVDEEEFTEGNASSKDEEVDPKDDYDSKEDTDVVNKSSDDDSFQVPTAVPAPTPSSSSSSSFSESTSPQVQASAAAKLPPVYTVIAHLEWEVIITNSSHSKVIVILKFM